MPPDEPAIVMRDVQRRIGDATILADVSLTVAPGDTLHIVGPSGSGKSALLRLINRLDEPTGTGDLSILGKRIGDWPVRELRRQVAMVLQEPTLLSMSVRENLMLPLRLVGDQTDDNDDRIASSLRRVGLDATLADRTADQLSVGQKQRVTLARALMVAPKILLLDEPTASVDVRTAEQLLSQIKELAAESGLTVVMVTHRLEEARQMGGQVAVLMDGRLEAMGGVEVVFDHPPSDKVRDFLHGDNHDA